MISHFTPDFLQNKLNGMQLLMYVLFIPIVWFTFQYNLMHYASFFQELYWVLALGVSLCPTLLYIVIKAGLLDLTTILSRRKNCKNYISIYMFQYKNFVLCWFVFHTWSLAIKFFSNVLFQTFDYFWKYGPPLLLISIIYLWCVGDIFRDQHLIDLAFYCFRLV